MRRSFNKSSPCEFRLGFIHFRVKHYNIFISDRQCLCFMIRNPSMGFENRTQNIVTGTCIASRFVYFWYTKYNTPPVISPAKDTLTAYKFPPFDGYSFAECRTYPLRLVLFTILYIRPDTEYVCVVAYWLLDQSPNDRVIPRGEFGTHTFVTLPYSHMA